MLEALLTQIEVIWQQLDEIAPEDDDIRKTVERSIDALDSGDLRVATIENDEVVVDERVRKAILLAFRLFPMKAVSNGYLPFADRIFPKQKVPPGVRMVPGAIARRGSYLAPGAVLMPSFVNIGAYIGRNTMVDTWATVGSCAQIGERVHISGGAGIGGVLEPAGAIPVTVEDDAFVGSRAIVVEGARVRKGAKLGAGVLLTGSTHVFDAATGDELEPGIAPAWSVCVTAFRNRSFSGGEFGVPCLLVLKRLAEGSVIDKLAIDELFRQHGFAA
ncbi:2,3,4,5-tetrahydropyridine-2,6-dicarboxylate N-succinyltransferase [Mycobacterium gordonae]|uniref:2,3,4,5-tetrahydropyridine-2,6-dicarboxylate N-succinyltransferase n=1 Tax=Mycobacterium gordonae TaxID=1778 RepID=UPI0006E386E7|nr:2,3,4,5-tetrahydropyridine-2,6-dicarboxylate N-succinyltransferase [Mycobacterium gordonae]